MIGVVGDGVGSGAVSGAGSGAVSGAGSGIDWCLVQVVTVRGI